MCGCHELEFRNEHDFACIILQSNIYKMPGNGNAILTQALPNGLPKHLSAPLIFTSMPSLTAVGALNCDNLRRTGNQAASSATFV